MSIIVTIKFRTAGKHYDFNARDFELDTGDRVVVETDRGRALGIVVAPPVEADINAEKRELKSVLRLATEEDLQLAATNAAREEEAFRYCKTKISERRMEMKLVKAEYLFDGSKIIFYFTADGRVDFRELVKDLAHHFHTRIEMRQIGVRDEAKLIGGIGVCGLTLCCCTFLTEFSPVSVKMAKEQQLALNPNKISGQCGRLLCCLGYEYETYCKMRKGMPKHGLKISVEGVNAHVIETDILRQMVTVRLEEGRLTKLTRDEFTEFQASGKLPEKEPLATLGDVTPAKPEPEQKKQEEQTPEKPKRKRRRRRRKSSGDKDEAGRATSNETKKPDAGRDGQDSKDSSAKQGRNKPEQAKEGTQGTSQPGDQKKRRRRRRRRKGPKPEQGDKKS